MAFAVGEYIGKTLNDDCLNNKHQEQTCGLTINAALVDRALNVGTCVMIVAVDLRGCAPPIEGIEGFACFWGWEIGTIQRPWGGLGAGADGDESRARQRAQPTFERVCRLRKTGRFRPRLF